MISTTSECIRSHKIFYKPIKRDTLSSLVTLVSCIVGNWNILQLSYVKKWCYFLRNICLIIFLFHLNSSHLASNKNQWTKYGVELANFILNEFDFRNWFQLKVSMMWSEWFMFENFYLIHFSLSMKGFIN